MHLNSRSTITALVAAVSVVSGSPFPDIESRANNAQASDIAFPQNVKANPRGGNKDLIRDLMITPVQRDRIKLLNQPGDWKFDFLNPNTDSEAVGKGGRTVSADSSRFPALLGNGVAMAVGFLGPCGFNTPHVHPRGTELNIPVVGKLVTEFIMENNVDPVQNYVDTFQMTVFPMGATHAEFNPECGNTTFVAAFSSADAGVQQIAQSFFGLRTDMTKATLGMDGLSGADLESFRPWIPKNVALGVESCLTKCNIHKNAKRDLTMEWIGGF